MKDQCNVDGVVPACTTIGGSEKRNSNRSRLKRDDDSAIWLDERLSADAVSIICCSLGRSPGYSTISRCTRQFEIYRACTAIVKIIVTVTVEGAAGCIITSNPVFVEKDCRTKIRHYYRVTT